LGKVAQRYRRHAPKTASAAAPETCGFIGFAKVENASGSKYRHVPNTTTRLYHFSMKASFHSLYFFVYIS
jgi:hypothetical protein